MVQKFSFSLFVTLFGIVFCLLGDLPNRFEIRSLSPIQTFSRNHELDRKAETILQKLGRFSTEQSQINYVVSIISFEAM